MNYNSINLCYSPYSAYIICFAVTWAGLKSCLFLISVDSDVIVDKEIDLAIVARFIPRMACHWDNIGMQLRQHVLVRNLRRVPNYDIESFCSQVIEAAQESGCLQTYGTLLEILESSGVNQQKVATDLRKAVLREGEKARKRGKQGTSAPSQKLTASLLSSTSINA